MPSTSPAMGSIDSVVTRLHHIIFMYIFRLYRSVNMKKAMSIFLLWIVAAAPVIACRFPNHAENDCGVW